MFTFLKLFSWKIAKTKAYIFIKKNNHIIQYLIINSYLLYKTVM